MRLLEQFRMRASSHENDLFTGRARVYAVDQNPVTADMTIPALQPFALQGMILELRGKRSNAVNQELHHVLQLVHRVVATAREPLPVFTELLCDPAFSWGSCLRAHLQDPLLCCSERGPDELQGWQLE